MEGVKGSWLSWFFCFFLQGASIYTLLMPSMSCAQNSYIPTTIKDTIASQLNYHKENLHFAPNLEGDKEQMQYSLTMPGAQVDFNSDGIDFTLYSIQKPPSNIAASYPSIEEDVLRRRRELESRKTPPVYQVSGHQYRFSWVGSNSNLQWQAIGRQEQTYNVFKGDQWHKEISPSKELWINELYHKIDIRFYSGRGGALEYDYVIHPGSDPSQIELKINGVDQLIHARDGSLILQTTQGEIPMSVPVAYQIIQGVKREVSCSYVRKTNNTIGIAIDPEQYNDQYLLVIDPVVIDWSTYYGGSLNDVLAAMVKDESGIYALFSTLSLDFPVSPGAFQLALSGNQDLAVVKLNNDGSRAWTTYIGGEGFESANDLKVDDGHVYIVGETSSDNYPVSPGAFQAQRRGFSNWAITALGKANGGLSWSTYLGGNSFEFNAHLILGDSGILITGYSGSDDYPTTTNAFQETPPSSSTHAVVSFMDKQGALSWSTYFGISGPSREPIIFADGLYDDDVFVLTGRAPLGLPTTTNAVASTNQGATGGFLAIFKAQEGKLTYASYLQNAGEYSMYQILQDVNRYYLLGLSDNRFITSSMAFQSRHGGGSTDLLLASIDKISKQIEWSTFIGGNQSERIDYSSFDRRTLRQDGQKLYLTGITTSPDFPVTEEAFQSAGQLPVGRKAIASAFQKIDGKGAWSTYISNASSNTGDDIALLSESNGHLFLGIRTQSDGHFVSPTAIQPVRYGQYDLLINELDPSSGTPFCGTYLGGSESETLTHMSAFDGKPLVAGNLLSDDFPVSLDGALVEAPSLLESAFIVQLNPCCVSIENNKVAPLLQESCISGTPRLIEGTEASYDGILSAIIRGGVLSSQEGRLGSGQYIWEESEDNENWRRIQGATFRNYQPPSLAATRFYRRIAGCDTSAVAQVLVNNLQAPQLNPGGPFVGCLESQIQLGATPTVLGANGDFTILWSPAHLLSDPSIERPIATLSRSTVFTAEVVDDQGCRTVKSTTGFVLEPLRQRNIQICAGTSVRIGEAPLPVSADINYSWSIVEGDMGAIIGSNQVARPLISPNTNTILSRSVTIDQFCSLVDTVFVTVKPQLVADAGQDLIVCNGETILLAEEVAELDDVEYRWLPSLGLNQSNVLSPSFDGRPRGACLKEQFILEVRDPSGLCPSQKDSLEIDIIIADAGIDGCGPRYIGTPDLSCDRFTYSWEVISGDVNSIVGQTHVPRPFVDPQEPTTYRLTVSHKGKSCTSEVVVPACECPVDLIVATVPLDCDSKESILPFCVELPQVSGFQTRLITQDNRVRIEDNKLSLLDTIVNELEVLVAFENDRQVCITRIVFKQENPILPFLTTSSISICPENQTEDFLTIGTQEREGYTYQWLSPTGVLQPQAATTLLDWRLLPIGNNIIYLEVKHVSSGCLFLLPQQINILSPQADAGPDRSFCGGIFTVLGEPNNSGFQYRWTPSDGLNNDQVAQPELLLFEGPGDYSYVLQVTDPTTGCSSVDSVKLTIVDQIEIQFPEEYSICSGERIRIGDPNAPVLGYRYRWEPAEGLSNPNVPAPFANPSVTTTYSLFVSLDGTAQCDASRQVNVRVLPEDVRPANLLRDSVICSPDSILIGVIAEPGLIYHWSPEAGLDHPNASQINVFVDASVVYELRVIDRSTCIIWVDSIWITLQESVFAAGPDQSICVGDSVLLGRIEMQGADYNWSPINGLDNPFISRPNASPSATTLYTLSLLINNCLYEDEVLVSVLERPIANAGPDQETCGVGVVLGPSSVRPDWNYSWSPSRGLSASNIANPFANPNTQQTYILSVSNKEGCAALDTVLVIPRINVSPGQMLFKTCLGEQVSIGVPELSPELTFEWFPLEGLLNPFSTKPTFLADQVGAFTFVLDISDGICTRQFEYQIIVEDPGFIDLALNQLTACKDGCVEINATVSEDITSFNWSPVTGVLHPGSPTTFICPETSGFYVLTGINPRNRCVVSDTVFINVLGISAPLAFAGIDTTLCLSDSIILGQSREENLFYSWTPSNALLEPFISNPIFVPLEGGRFDFLLEVYDPMTNCLDIDQVNIEVVDFEINIEGPTLACKGEAVDLLLNISNNPLGLRQEDFEIIWTSDGHIIGEGATIAITIDSALTLEVNVIHTPTGCFKAQSTRIGLRGDVLLNVNLPSEIAFCTRNTPFQIPLDPQEGFTYRWQPSFRLSNPNIANPIINTPIPIGTVYQVTIEDTRRTDECRIAIRQVRLIESEPIQIQSDQYTVCEGNPTLGSIGPMLDAQNAIYSYQWSPSQGLSNPLIANPQVDLSVQNTYVLRVNKRNSSETQYANCAVEIPYLIRPRPQPLVAPGGDKAICEPGEIVIGGPSQSNLIYSWSPGNVLNDSTLVRPTASIDRPTVFTLSVTDLFGCSNQDSISVIISDIEVVLTSFESPSCDTENKGRLAVRAAGGLGPYTYVWSTNDGSGIIEGSVNQNSLSPGTYVVEVTDDGGCTAIASFTLEAEGSCCDTIHLTRIPPNLKVPCDEVIPLSMPEAANHCCPGELTIQVDTLLIGLGCAGNFIEQRRFVVEDICGNRVIYVQEIERFDDQPPRFISCTDLNETISCSIDQVHQIEAWEQYVRLYLRHCYEDNCDPVVRIMSDFSLQNFDHGCGQSGSLSVTFWGVDLCGNVGDSVVYTITVLDNQGPIWQNCPNLDQTVACGQTPINQVVQLWHNQNLSALMNCAQDGCGGAVFITHNFNLNQYIQGDCDSEGQISVTYFARDFCNNSSAAITATLSIVDITPPSWTGCPSLNQSVSCIHFAGNTDIQEWHTNNINSLLACVQDNCSTEISISSDYNIDNFVTGCGSSGTLTVNYYLIDACGNSSSPFTAIYEVLDEGTIQLVPCITELDQVLGCSENTIFTITNWHESNVAQILNCGASDCNSGLIVTSDFNISNFIPGCGNSGSITINYFLTSGCDVSLFIASATLTFEGGVTPELSLCSLTDMAISCDMGNLEALAQQWHHENLENILNCATEFCHQDITILSDFTFEASIPDCQSPTSVPVSYSIIDECGQASEEIIVFIHIIPPQQIDITSCIVSLDTLLSCSSGANNALPNWHQHNLNQLQSCIDQSCPGGFSLHADYDGTSVQLGACQEDSFSINYYVLNLCGDTLQILSATAMFELSNAPILNWVNDQFPDYTHGDTLFVECLSNQEGWSVPEFNDQSIEASDYCGAPLLVQFTEEYYGSGNCMEDGYFYGIRHVWKAIDACGNQDSFILYTQIQDVTAPVISGVPQNITVQCTEIPICPESIVCPEHGTSCCPESVIVMDACECATLHYEEWTTHGSSADHYLIFRQWTAEDNCGNTTAATQVITVIRPTDVYLTPVLPSLVGLSPDDSITFECIGAGQIPNEVFQFKKEDVIAIGLCPEDPAEIQYALYVEEEDAPCLEVGYLHHLMPSWTLRSNDEPIAYFILHAYVTDTSAPFVTGSPVVCSEENLQISVEDCSDILLNYSDSFMPSICPDLTGQDLVRTWIAVDRCGNSSQMQQRVVQGESDIQQVSTTHLLLQQLSSGDTISLACHPQAETISGFLGEDLTLLSYCGELLETYFTETILEEGCEAGSIETLLATWYADDPCRGRVEWSIIIYLIDNTPPIFQENLIELACGDVIRMPEVTDDCSLVSIHMLSEHWIPGSHCAQYFLLDRTYEATDACGNTTTANVLYKINRNSSVVFQGLPEGTICHADQIAQVSAIDPCTGITLPINITESIIPNPCTGGNQIRRVWKAIDACGLEHEAIRYIQIGAGVPQYSFLHPIHGSFQSGSTIQVECNSGVNPSLDFSSSNILYNTACHYSINLHRQTLSYGDCFLSKVLYRELLVWEITDECGNQQSFQLIVEWMDDKSPIFNDPPLDLNIGCQELPPAIPPSIEEECAEVIWTMQEQSIQTPLQQQVTRTWTATDLCGNSSQWTQTITQVDDSSMHCTFGEFLTPICNSSSNSLSVFVEGGIEPYTYHWMVEGGACEFTSGQGTSSVTFNIGFSRVNLAVRVTDASGCETICYFSFDCEIDPKVRADEGTETTLDFGGIFPNPSHQYVFIRYITQKSQWAKVTLYDALGSVVREKNQWIKHDEREFLFSLEDLPAGVYYLTLSGNDSRPQGALLIKY